MGSSPDRVWQCDVLFEKVPKREISNSNLKFLARGTLLYTHHFERPRSDRWQTNSLHVFTTPHTRSLVIMVQDAEGARSSKPRNAWFDDLAVDRLEPRLTQELALFKAFGLAPGSDPELGIAKHAQLLPVSGDVEPPNDVNYEFRHALFAPAPTLIRAQRIRSAHDTRNHRERFPEPDLGRGP